MENKTKFVDQLGILLLMYSREKIKKLEYIRKDETELVEITYINRHKRCIDITGDSYIAIMSDIYKALH